MSEKRIPPRYSLLGPRYSFLTFVSIIQPQDIAALHTSRYVLHACGFAALHTPESTLK